MVRFLAFLLVLGWSGMGLGAEVSADTAAKVGYAFAQQNAILSGSVTGVGTPYAFGARWVVPLEPSGYVLVESDDTLKPVVAFALEDFPDLEGAPEGLIAFFAGDTSRAITTEETTEESSTETTTEESSEEGTTSAEAVTISTASDAVSVASLSVTSLDDETTTSVVLPSVTEETTEESIEFSEDANADWSQLINSMTSADSGISLMADAPTDVANIKYLNLTPKWNQCLPYNLYAPGLTEVIGTGYGGDYGWRGAAGCVAIAEAQIAAYVR